MGLPNMIYQGIADETILQPLGIKKLQSGLYSLPGEGNITRWHVGKWQAKVRIHAFIETLAHDFGNYHAHFSRYTSYMRNPTSSMYERVIDPESSTRLRVTGKRGHPHFNGQMCWGNMTGPRDYALERHDIETVSGLVALTLRTYNPRAPYGGWWTYRDVDVSSDLMCISCGTKTHGEWTCSGCMSCLCAECTMKCYDAEGRHVLGVYCRSCLVDTICQGERCAHKKCILHPGHLPEQSSWSSWTRVSVATRSSSRWTTGSR